MTTLSLKQVNQVYWEEISKKCNKAVVFIDDAAAECLHWCGGMRLLPSAQLIRQFSSFESAPPACKKGVFIVKNPADRQSERILRDIITTSNLEFCTVITWCQPNVLSWCKYPARDFNTDDKSGVEWLEDNLLSWMGNLNYTAQVFYYPIFMVSPSPKTFYTPGYHSLFPLLPDDVAKATAMWKIFNPGQANRPTSDTPDWALFPQELQVAVRQLVANLHSLLATLGLREDIWSVGPFARCVADQLESWTPARNRRKTANTAGGPGLASPAGQSATVSLILVDRSLDLAGSVGGQDNTSVLARVLEAHSKLPGGHTLDIGVEISDLMGVESSSVFVPGSLANPGLSDTEEEEFEALLVKSEREVLNLLHGNLVKSSPKKREGGRKKSLGTATIEADLKDFTMDHEAIFSNLSTISKARAVLTSQDSEVMVRRKKILSLAAQYCREIATGGVDGVLAELTDLIRCREDSRLTMRDILVLLVFIYSAVDCHTQFREEEEERLKSVLGEALLVEGRAGRLDTALEAVCHRETPEGGEVDELVALSVVNSLWLKLEGMLTARRSLNNYSSLIDPDGNYRGLLQQLLGDIYHESRMEVTDLHHHSGGLGAMLRTGLGWLGGGLAASNKQHPRQNPWVIVFVLGGVTPGEIKQLQSVVQGTGSRLTVAGTGIITPSDALNLIFNNNPLMTGL